MARCRLVSVNDCNLAQFARSLAAAVEAGLHICRSEQFLVGKS